MTDTGTVLADGLDRLELVRQDAWQAWRDGQMAATDLNLITEAGDIVLDIAAVFAEAPCSDLCCWAADFEDALEALRPLHDRLQDAATAVTSQPTARQLGEASSIVSRLFTHLNYVAAYGGNDPAP